MEKLEQLVSRLREQGFKITPQRLAIIELLRETKHPSAEEIYKKLVEDYPMLSRATVYNTLEALKGLGEIAEIHIKPNVALYDPEIRSHYHFLCRRCDSLIDVEPLPEYELEKLSLNLSFGRLKGYKIERGQVYLYGICATCLKKEKNVGGLSPKQSRLQYKDKRGKLFFDDPQDPLVHRRIEMAILDVRLLREDHANEFETLISMRTSPI